MMRSYKRTATVTCFTWYTAVSFATRIVNIMEQPVRNSNISGYNFQKKTGEILDAQRITVFG